LRCAQKLTARAAATSKPGRYGDGSGLYLVVSSTGARKWVFRFPFDGRVTEMGLRSAEIVSLAEARDKAHAGRKIRRAGQNPIEAEREAAASETGKPDGELIVRNKPRRCGLFPTPRLAGSRALYLFCADKIRFPPKPSRTTRLACEAKIVMCPRLRSRAESMFLANPKLFGHVQPTVAIRELLRAGYLPNRGASVTRRELRCPVK